ncbi:response regulator [Clostridium chromiireducens]|nr:response regulator [Clostridium chromiireducens]
MKKLMIGQKMFLGFGIVILIMLAVIGNSYMNFIKESEAVEWSVHTYEVIQESDELLNSLVSMETGARGYVITGDKSFLEPFNQGENLYNQHYNKLKELTEDNPDQQQRLSILDKQYREWLNWENTKIITNRQKVTEGQSELQEIITIVQSGEGKTMMDNMRLVLGEINSEEKRLLQNRNTNLVIMENETKTIMLAGGITATVVAAIIASLVVRMILKPVKVVTNTFKEIAEENVNLEARLEINSKDELGDMAKYFNIFMTKLKKLIVENRNQSWLSAGRAELSEEVRGIQDISELSLQIISYICRYVDAQIGRIYILTDKNTYKLHGGYADKTDGELLDEFHCGEGLVGQSALEKKSILIKNVPENYMKITSGVGEAIPRNILVIPCIHHNEVECIIELGAFNEFTDVQLKFIEQVNENIAISINSTKAQLKMKELLNKTLVQAEELQVQQEELRQNNEELEEQATILKHSEINLQTQQEELKVSNEELQEQAQELEIQKRVISENNENLRKANSEINKKAEDLKLANKYKSEFLANMSHELRTPLNSILVLSQLLENNKDSEILTDKQREYARTIHTSGENLLRLINDILDLSKVEAGKMDINFEEVYLAELAEDIKRLFNPISLQKGLAFEVRIEEGIPEKIVSDKQRLQQIISNLLANAFKFTSEGSIVMNIYRTKEHDIEYFDIKGEAGNLISIEVTDTGIGIPEDKQKLIFEEFKQVDGTISRKFGGTGLGLSISKEFANLLGGTIYLKSKEGMGSTFILVISSYDDSSIDLKQLKGESYINKETNTPVNREINYEEIKRESERLILIIEDDKQFLSVLSELAEKKGYKVLAVNNGREGIELAEGYKPDAILLDIGLPDISGWMVADKLKSMEVTMNIPIHVISGRDDMDSFERQKNLVELIKKPVNLEEIDNLFNNIEANMPKKLKKLLIIDKNREEVNSIYNNLSQKGFEVTILDSGLQASNLIKTEQFDCLILDLKLKDMTGIELLEKLEEESVIKFPILIHTEEDITQDDEAKLKKYVDSIIIKGKRSIDRLIDEASLFFNDVDSKLEDKKIQDISYNHERESSLANKKVLIIDDDMRNVFSLSNALEEKGISTIVGRNGAEGIEKLHENLDTDLIIMDVMMPEMDGYTAMKKIRKDVKFQNVPIIAITAKAMKDDRQKCIEAGANDYLTKPIEIDRLISLLRVWLYK